MRVTIEKTIFSINASIPTLIVVERRNVDDIERELHSQANGKVKDQDPAKIGHSIGLDYVVASFEAPVLRTR